MQILFTKSNKLSGFVQTEMLEKGDQAAAANFGQLCKMNNNVPEDIAK